MKYLQPVEQKLYKSFQLEKSFAEYTTVYLRINEEDGGEIELRKNNNSKFIEFDDKDFNHPKFGKIKISVNEKTAKITIQDREIKLNRLYHPLENAKDVGVIPKNEK